MIRKVYKIRQHTYIVQVQIINFNRGCLLMHVGSDPDQLPLERQIRLEDPTNLNPLLQV